MLYLLTALGLSCLVLGAMGYIVDRPPKRERRALPEPRRKEVEEE